MSAETELRLVIRDDGYGNYRLVVMMGDHVEHTTVEAHSAKHVAYQLSILLSYLVKLEYIR